MTTTTENKKRFTAEVNQILDLVINSLYSNRDIFLRELISNASDALDKLRFLSLQNQELRSSDEELKITIETDKDKRQVIITDNGVGMNEQDLENNLGTIAKSGTKEFVQNFSEQDQTLRANLIGQFGVGFYSAFIVANEVQVISRKAGENTVYEWISQGKGEYSITLIDNKEFQVGTKIILNIKPEEEFNDYLQEWKLRSIVKEYSDFVEYPINLRKKDPEKENEFIWETVNSRKAIWTKSKDEITEEEHKEFYRHLSHDFTDPFEHIHYQAEGTNEFTALIYLPSKAGFDMFIPENKKGLSLYINKVFITNETDLLTPSYLRFIKGVVDAKDLPLNVSRELLQRNSKVAAIKKNITKKILSNLHDLQKKERTKFFGFYKEFGKILKEGVHTDAANKDKILDLLMYQSSKTATDEFITLQEYVNRMPAEQECIYFIVGENRQDLESSPYLETLKAKDIEVLFMTDVIDEWVTMSGGAYQEKTFKSITKADFSADEKQKEEIKNKEEQAKDLLEFIKSKLSGEISEVKFTQRLVDTPCCLVTSEHSISANLERIYKNANQEHYKADRILELNPEHQVVKKIEDQFKSNKDSQELDDLVFLIYNQALLLEGSKIKDTPRFTRLFNKLLV